MVAKMVNNDDKILHVLRKYDKPIPFDALSILSGIRKDKLSQRLRQMERYGFVRKKYKRVTSFWISTKKIKMRENVCNQKR
jgi:DNA-binding HxlR family transcriptional regulator